MNEIASTASMKKIFKSRFNTAENSENGRETRLNTVEKLTSLCVWKKEPSLRMDKRGRYTRSV